MEYDIQCNRGRYTQDDWNRITGTSLYYPLRTKLKVVLTLGAIPAG